MIEPANQFNSNWTETKKGVVKFLSCSEIKERKTKNSTIASPRVNMESKEKKLHPGAAILLHRNVIGKQLEYWDHLSRN